MTLVAVQRYQGARLGLLLPNRALCFGVYNDLSFGRKMYACFREPPKKRSVTQKTMTQSFGAWCSAHDCAVATWDSDFGDAVCEAHAALASLGTTPVSIPAASAWCRELGCPALRTLAAVRSDHTPRNAGGCCGATPGQTDCGGELRTAAVVWFLEQMERTPGDALRGHGDVLLDPYPALRASIARWYTDREDAKTTAASAAARKSRRRKRSPLPRRETH